jgi:hypothetical protein
LQTATSIAFVLRDPSGAVRLRSRSGKPTRVTPWSEDRRRLGLPISGLTIQRTGMPRDIPIDHPCLTTGWHDVERDGSAWWRWTDGDAVLPAALFAGGTGPMLIGLRLNGSMQYALAPHGVAA